MKGYKKHIGYVASPDTPFSLAKISGEKKKTGTKERKIEDTTQTIIFSFTEKKVDFFNRLFLLNRGKTEAGKKDGRFNKSFGFPHIRVIGQLH